jgi:hypothetical protein
MLHAAGALLLLVFIGVLAAGVMPYGAGSLRWARFFFRGWVVVSSLWVEREFRIPQFLFQKPQQRLALFVGDLELHHGDVLIPSSSRR